MSTQPTLTFESNLPRGPLRLAQGGAQIIVFQSPNHDEADFYIPPADIDSVSVTERAGQASDTGTLEIDNTGGKYTQAGSEFELGMDDRITFRVQLASRQRGAGEGPAGVGIPDGWRQVADWILTSPPTIESEGSASTVEFDVQDYVWGILRERVVSYNGSDAPIAGDIPGESPSHLNRLLARKCPRIETERIDDIEALIDFNAHGLTMSEVVDRLVGHTAVERGSAIAYSRGRNLVFTDVTRLPRPFRNTDGTIDPALGPDDFMGDIKSSPTSQAVINTVRVDGGIDSDNIEANPVESFDRFAKVSKENPLTAELYVRKSQIPKIQIYTKGGIQSSDPDGEITSELRVRVQSPNPDRTGPIDLFDTDSDITSAVPREIAISIDDWTKFPLQTGDEHTVNDLRPWLIIDTTGEQPYEVGVNVDGVPLHRVYFSKTIIALDQNSNSLGRYLPHERLIEDEGLMTRQAARDRAREAISRNPVPSRTISGQAATERCHNLRVGDVVPFEWPLHQIGADRGRGGPKDYLVVARGVDYENRLLNTELEFQGTTAVGTSTQPGVVGGRL